MLVGDIAVAKKEEIAKCSLIIPQQNVVPIICGAQQYPNAD